ncbi:MAG: hypothetical protein COS95_09180 [Ignavibacteriales bacterium CG07_land_8_20_14_0_80_59_12]|nr:MAG: hypothetical protein COS95_09180 [Ignavibacteriales bacterium CG07_land_8_20_14_0_80_59_12]
MDADFYRREPPRRRHFLGGIFKSRRRVIVLTLGLLFLGFATFSSHGIIQRIRLEVQRRSIERSIKQAKAEQDSLKEELRRIQNDPKKIEKVARERYGMVREGERVYRVQKRE